MSDTTRDRKVRMSRLAMQYLFAGLLFCLMAGVFRPEAAMVLVGIYSPFCVGVAGVLAFFASANARVHEAQAGTEGQP